MGHTNRIDDLVKALFKLSRKTASEIAKFCDLQRPNLLDAVAGKRGIPAIKQDRLNEALGIAWGMPLTDHIHYWTVGVDLEALKIAVAAFFPSGATIAGLWRESGRMFDISRAVQRQQYAIYDDRTLVILMRNNFGVHHLLAEPIGPESIHELAWRGGRVGHETMVSLPKMIFQGLVEASYSDVNTMRQYLKSTPSVTWEDFLRYVQQQWRTANEAMDAILNLTNNQSDSKDNKSIQYAKTLLPNEKCGFESEHQNDKTHAQHASRKGAPDKI